MLPNSCHNITVNEPERFKIVGRPFHNTLDDSITRFALCCAAGREAVGLSAAHATDQSVLLGGTLSPPSATSPKRSSPRGGF